MIKYVIYLLTRYRLAFLYDIFTFFHFKKIVTRAVSLFFRKICNFSKVHFYLFVLFRQEGIYFFVGRVPELNSPFHRYCSAKLFSVNATDIPERLPKVQVKLDGRLLFNLREVIKFPHVRRRLYFTWYQKERIVATKCPADIAVGKTIAPVHPVWPRRIDGSALC